MKAVLISVFFSLVIFYLLVLKDREKAILIIVFMLPIGGDPLINNVIDTGLRLNIVSVLIFVYWFTILMTYKKSEINRIPLKRLSPKIKYIFIFVLWGVFLGIIYLQDGNDYLVRGIKHSPIFQILNNSIFMILIIIFFKILSPFIYDSFFRSKMAKVFIITIFLNLFSSLLYVFGAENFLWGLFKTLGVFEGTDIRINGLYASFGFGVYVTSIVAFSLLYYNRHKLLSISAIVAVIIFSILSGSRQTIVFIVLFVFIFTIILSIKNKMKWSYKLILLIITIGFLVSYETVFSKYYVFDRFTPGVESVRQGEILIATGRDALAVPDVLADISTYPIMGKGLLDLYATKNSSTNLAGHVIWFNIIKKYGIFGLICLLIVFIYPIVKLLAICIETNNTKILREGAILCALMVIVFAQQFWDNFFWFSNTMLLYGFIYFWYFSFINNTKINSVLK
jgi:hypothetical protein